MYVDFKWSQLQRVIENFALFQYDMTDINFTFCVTILKF